MNPYKKRLTDLETTLRTVTARPSCATCHGSGRFVLAVPDDAAPDDPAYLPKVCPECGRAVRNVLRIIGMTQEEIA